MHGFMAARVPTRALLQSHRMIRAADQNPAAADLLEMAFHAQVRVPRREHLRVHRTVRRVTNRATLAQRLMFKSLRTPLRRMAAQAALVFRQHGGPASLVNGGLVR